MRKMTAVAAMLALAGCGSASNNIEPLANEAAPVTNAPEPAANIAAPAPSPSASPSPSPTPTPSPTPSPSEVPVADLLLSPGGWGPIRIGMRRAEVERLLGKSDSPNPPEDPGCDVFHPANAPEGLNVMVLEDKVSRISLYGKTALKTVHGITLGAPAFAVRAKLGKRLIAEPHKYLGEPAEYLTLWARGGADPANVRPNARGIRYVVGNEGKVEAIYAGDPSIEFVEGCA